MKIFESNKYVFKITFTVKLPSLQHHFSALYFSQLTMAFQSRETIIGSLTQLENPR